MADSQLIDPIDALSHETQVHSAKDKTQDPKPQQIDALVYAAMLIFDSVQTDHETARIQAKGLEVNAEAQNRLINREAQLNFETLRWTEMFSNKMILNADGPNFTHLTIKKVAQTVLSDLSTKNQEISAVRGIMEDQITLMRQEAQVKQAGLNSVLNEDQQAVQQRTSLMQMLTQLTNQISRI